MSTIGDRLRLFALSKYNRISDFAESIGMGAPNAQAYMRGARKPGSLVLRKIQSIGCNIDWLLTGEGEMYTRKEIYHEKEAVPDEVLESRSNALQRHHNQPLNDSLNDSPRMWEMPPDGITKALGKGMCVYGIQEGDLIILDDKNEPKEDELVLRVKFDVPIIEKFKTGDPPPYAVCTRLMRNLKPTAKPPQESEN
ncbi:MAG: helix-turn-helix transcriptional regulator [Chlorobiaceae bacterium]